jgi:hypothetical protein
LKVCLEYRDGGYFLRRFGDDYTKERYRVPERWLESAIDVPDHVVECYAALQSQSATMQTLLMMLEHEAVRKEGKL